MINLKKIFLCLIILFSAMFLYGEDSTDGGTTQESHKKTGNFFSKVFYDRESRWLIGYNYFPDFPISMEFGYLRDGLGFYVGCGTDPMVYYGLLNYHFGFNYPLYFDWLWLSGGGEICLIHIVKSQTKIDNWTYNEIDEDLVFNPSMGIYLTFKRFYITTKYRYCFYGNGYHNFMFGLGICL